MVVNKVGDIGVLLGIVLLWKMFGSMEYNCIFPLGYLMLESEFILN
jgi:NADH:ubiquinone oxidoreductase subunit 5 (subunit L)/multisubunit Na+/H+ antiporter MnhA subunit